ncbi:MULTISPECIES: DMT family transporter [Wolbachia]|uniref:S-adenosylmethionine uptake transporter n=1 Tax=Wolbachia pipientis TaxID=955 RepID=A0A6C1U1R8_WOLPI|nr:MULTISPECIES: DMT family transporter [Wolbachia]UYC24263.1 DMT family transporter [Wolbachia endosymbiont of Aedes aegypti]QBB84416.1 EamA/RhaT family transporter [Wolbachia pipientis wAlbB]QDW09210.1 DMT family transporter [Wolbachia pipientis]QDW10408.1 DMT family transporter [Wolbachia pipientis]QZA83481.1 DMT family transporter [Wolbachia pipientis]
MDYRLRAYLFGVIWFILSLLSSAANDTISKYLSLHLQSFEIIFFRFLFTTITLVPFMFYYGIEAFKTSQISIQITRGTLLFFGMVLWTYGLSTFPIVTATIISFSIPLFVILLAIPLLNENIIWQRWIVTVIGFVGIAITTKAHSEDFNPKILIFIVSALIFAILDILNKKLVTKESVISMLFYSALTTTIFSTPPLLFYWHMPSLLELVLLLILGISSNLILFFMLKAFALTDATALAPYRYIELIISAIVTYVIFNELPDKSALYGTLILIPSTLFIAYSEGKAIKKNNVTTKVYNC